MRGPHICIPRLGSNIKKQYVFYVFKKLNVGKIMNVTIINLKRKNYNMCFVYIKKWKNTERVKKMLGTILEGGCFKIMHAFPSFWKCYLYNDSKDKYNHYDEKVANEVVSNEERSVEEEVEEEVEKGSVVEEVEKGRVEEKGSVVEEVEDKGVYQEEIRGVGIKNEVMIRVFREK